MAALRPDVVTILLGVNDCLGKIPVVSFAANYRQVLDAIRRECPVIPNDQGFRIMATRLAGELTSIVNPSTYFRNGMPIRPVPYAGCSVPMKRDR